MTSKVEYKGNLRTECIHIRSNSKVSTDAPIDNNGKGELFSPTDLVATALASCMITVMGIKAANAGIDFENISADVIKIMGSDPRRIEELKVVVSVSENWTDKEKIIMEKTGLTCPVAKSLHPNLLQRISFVYQ